MTKKLKKELKLKNGLTYAKGTSFSIVVNENNPMIAVLNDAVKIRSASLYKYFSGFISPSAEFTDPDFDGCIVPSLTGEQVESDGWDEDGFPSVLLSLGMI